MWYISYWFWPVFSSFVWLAMLIAMLVVWAKDGFPHYVSMEPGQDIAYISDIGANHLKPLFIAMSTVTVVSFDIAFILERWLRHTGRLAANTSVWQKLYSFLSIIAVIVGAAGLILLSIFDTVHHPKLHDVFLFLFIAGYIVSAIFICLEYHRLGVHYRHDSVLKYSFWIKLAFIVIELSLAIAFGVCGRKKLSNAAAVLEWTVSFIYFFYVLSFFIDFMPAIRTKHYQSRETEMDMRGVENGDQNLLDGSDAGGHGIERQYFRGPRATNGHANGHANGHVNGHTNAHANGYTNGTNGYTNGANGYTNGHVGSKPGDPGHF